MINSLKTTFNNLDGKIFCKFLRDLLFLISRMNYGTVTVNVYLPSCSFFYPFFKVFPTKAVVMIVTCFFTKSSHISGTVLVLNYLNPHLQSSCKIISNQTAKSLWYRLKRTFFFFIPFFVLHCTHTF